MFRLGKYGLSDVGTIVFLILAIPLFLLFAWVARRLLGVRRLSATKTVIAALVGLIIGFALGWVLESRGLDRDLALLAAIVLGLIFTMLTIITFEAIADPRRSAQGQGIPNPVAAVRRSVGVRAILPSTG